MFRILGKYRCGGIEEIDTAENLKEASLLLTEYKLAFGRDWILWIEPK